MSSHGRRQGEVIDRQGRKAYLLGTREPRYLRPIVPGHGNSPLRPNYRLNQNCASLPGTRCADRALFSHLFPHSRVGQTKQRRSRSICHGFGRRWLSKDITSPVGANVSRRPVVFVSVWQRFPLVRSFVLEPPGYCKVCPARPRPVVNLLSSC
jgi:hypothetical protein